MLIRFTVSNFLSFSQPIVFDMRPGNIQKEGKLWEHVHVDSVGKEVYTLPLGMIFGANASGKSNFIAALEFMRSCVLGTLQKQQGPAGEVLLPVVPFLLNPQSKNEPSTFEVQFKFHDVVYSYGFVISEKQIHEEWLYACFTSKETRLFHRFVQGKQSVFQWGAKLKKLQKIGEHLPSTILALSFFCESELLQPVYEWFTKLTVIFPNSEFSSLSQKVFQDPKFSTFLSDTLHEIDTGIEKVSALKKETSDQFLNQLPVSVQARSRQASNSNFPGKSYLYELFTHHSGNENIPFPIWLESMGTLRMIHLLPIFYMMCHNESNIFLIDELDNSLHTLLSRWFIQKYLDINQRFSSQLIFTTHDTNLLTNSNFRRDEIWFVEKSSDGSSAFSRLSEYKVSDGLNYENGYISGRFGGIPNFSEIF